MLDANLKKQLDTYLQNIAKLIEVSVSVDDSPKGKALYELASEIAEMSGKINLTDAADQRTPSMGVAAAGETPLVRFAGIPIGTEFTSLVLALLQAGGHQYNAVAAVLEPIRDLQGGFHFETYISLSCRSGADVVQALILTSTLNPNIARVMIEGPLFKDEVESRQIMAV